MYFSVQIGKENKQTIAKTRKKQKRKWSRGQVQDEEEKLRRC